ITNNKITIDGNYHIVPSEQIIKFSFKSSRNKIEKSSMKYSVKDDNLYLTLTFDDRKGKKIRPTNFILKKQLIENKRCTTTYKNNAQICLNSKITARLLSGLPCGQSRSPLALFLYEPLCAS